MKRIVVVAAVLAFSAGVVVAEQDQVKQTKAMMKDNGRNAGALAAMVKGEKPYDQSTVNAALAQFEETGKKLPTLFPDSVKGLTLEGDYAPSPKIWEDKPGFEQQVASFTKVVADSKGKVKDLDTLKAELPVIGKQCGGCHETYRLKKG